MFKKEKKRKSYTNQLMEGHKNKADMVKLCFCFVPHMCGAEAPVVYGSALKPDI